MIRRVFKRVLRYFGYEISKISKRVSNNSWFQFDVSCQIPFLSEIYEKVFGKETQGVLVEVGAFDGVTYSNSRGLLLRGWGGILVEPSPGPFQKCKALYADSLNVTVLQMAVSDEAGSLTLNLAGPLSTISHEQFIEYESQDWSSPSIEDLRIEVQTQTLDNILRQHGFKRNFELLIIDVEGFEENVLRGFTLDQWKPKMIIIELADFHPTLVASKLSHIRCREIIQSKGYQIIYRDSINTIYIDGDTYFELFRPR